MVLEVHGYEKPYTDYNKLKHIVSKSEYRNIVSLRLQNSFTIYLRTLNKHFYVNKIAVEDDLKLFNELYIKIKREMLQGNALLLEALNSAQIEGAKTTYADTLKIVTGKAKIYNKSERMVKNMYDVLDLLDYLQCLTLNKSLLLEFWKRITDGVRENSSVYKEGQYRNGVVYVVDGSDKIVHTGVEVDKLDCVMSEFIYLFNSCNDCDNVIMSFILHYLFVYIHPFCDGNGRLARFLNHQFLINGGLTKFGWFSLSSAINRTKGEYYKSLELSNNEHGDITFFVKYMLKAFNSLAIILIRGVKLGNIKLNMRQMRLIELLKKRNGVISINKYTKLNEISTSTAYKDFRELLQKGILIKEVAGKKATYRLNNELLGRE